MTFLEEFTEKIDISTYGPKQIYYSEMYAFSAAAKGEGVTRIVESGTFMGHSTSILAKLFPDIEIITYECLKDRYEQARLNLEEFPNVTCIHGKLGAKDYQWSLKDAVLIDGPKNKEAVKLAQKINNYGPPAIIAMHDMWRYLKYLSKRFRFVAHTGNPPKQLLELDKNIPYKKEHHHDGLYGCVLAIVK